MRKKFLLQVLPSVWGIAAIQLGSASEWMWASALDVHVFSPWKVFPRSHASTSL